MIRKKSLFFKLINLNFSSKSIIEAEFAKFKSELEVCPSCKSTGNCRIHAYYKRSLTDIHHGKRISFNLCIPRMICDSCQHTHAVLPDCIIPYKTFSLLFILRTLSVHFLEHVSKEAVCEYFDISMSTLDSFLLLFRKHKKLWLGILEDLESTDVDFLLSLINSMRPDFLSNFYLRFHRSFLQSHKDPP